MAKYLVHLDPSLNQVVISLDGFGPTAKDHVQEIGSFKLDINPNTSQFQTEDGNTGFVHHPLIDEAQRLLVEHLGDPHAVRGYTFIDRATNAVPDAEDASTMSTNDLPATEGPLRHSEASTQPGGEQDSQTGEHRPGTQQDGGTTEPTPAEELAEGEEQNAGDETVVALKERISKITDKAELEKAYKAEQEGKNRPTAIKAIEDRAAELAD